MMPERLDRESVNEESTAPLPSRINTPRRKKIYRSLPKRKKKKPGEFSFFKVWLVLFFTLVTAVATYPVWGTRLPGI